MAANRTSPFHEATLQATWLLQRLGRELRLARIAAGSSQAEVGRRLGLSKSEISRIERSEIPGLTVLALQRHAAVLGLQLSARLYPGGRRVLDAPQLALLGRARERLEPAWRWELEVPVPLPRDLRAVDARLNRGDISIVVEAITRLSDVQAQVRAAQLKARDLNATRLMLLVGGSSANRAALREAGPIIRAAFATGTRRLLATLEE
ncbi:MAG TPA: helix-turn-helix domain-containing protein, partial [Candidatus Limnocylindria bacterium]|nr:helix-turn-helix domain-containing protein [Candidatus Limnocylindria bacterium]